MSESKAASSSANMRPMAPMAKDPSMLKEAAWRHAMRRRNAVAGYINFGYWTKVAARAEPYREHFLHTVTLDNPVYNLSQGPGGY
jgi:hypothetical protein